MGAQVNVELSKMLVCPECERKHQSVDPATFHLAEGAKSLCSIRCALEDIYRKDREAEE